MIYTYKVRLMTTEKQEKLLNLHCRAHRVAYNHAIWKIEQAYKNSERMPGKLTLSKSATGLRVSDSLLACCSFDTASFGAIDASDAFGRYFKTLKTLKSNGSKTSDVKPPSYRRREDSNSFHTRRLKVESGRVRLPV